MGKDKIIKSGTKYFFNRYFTKKNISQKMKNVLLLTITILLTDCSSFSENVDDKTSLENQSLNVEKIKSYPRSINYWVNIDYLNCIEKGEPVCDCLSANEYVLVYHNEKITPGIKLNALV